MTVAKKIAQNTAYLFVAEVISKIAFFLLVIFIARKLGDIEFGKYSFAMSYGFLFTIIANCGLDILLIRNVAREKEKIKKYIDNVSLLKIFLSIFSFLSLVLIINIFEYDLNTKIIVYIFGLSLILSTFANTFRSVFFAFEEMSYESLIKISERVSIVFFGCILIFLGYGLFHIALVFLIISILNILFSFLVVNKKFVKPNFEFDWKFWKFLLKDSWPFALMGVFWVLYLRIDIIMISLMKGYAVAGWYNASFQIIEALSFIPIVFMNAVFPVMSKFYFSNKSNLNMIYEKSFKYLLILVLPIAVGIFMLSDRFIYLVYGKQFINSIFALKILIISLIFAFIIRPVNKVLVAIGKQKIPVYLTVIIGPLNIILNIILIPIFSLNGAAIATLISEILLFLITYFFLYKYSYRISLFKMSFKVIIASIIMGLFIYLFYSINLILLIFLSAIIYILAIFLLKIFDKIDFKLFKEVLNINNNNEIQ